MEKREEILEKLNKADVEREMYLAAVKQLLLSGRQYTAEFEKAVSELDTRHYQLAMYRCELEIANINGRPAK